MIAGLLMGGAPPAHHEDHGPLIDAVHHALIRASRPDRKAELGGMLAKLLASQSRAHQQSQQAGGMVHAAPPPAPTSGMLGGVGGAQGAAGDYPDTQGIVGAPAHPAAGLAELLARIYGG